MEEIEKLCDRDVQRDRVREREQEKRTEKEGRGGTDIFIQLINIIRGHVQRDMWEPQRPRECVRKRR